jgi:hypothetical protein
MKESNSKVVDRIELVFSYIDKIKPDTTIEYNEPLAMSSLGD